MTSGISAVMRSARGRAIEKEYARLLETISPTNPVRMVTKLRKMFLLRGQDTVFYRGIAYQVRWKHLGSGIWEASLEANGQVKE